MTATSPVAPTAQQRVGDYRLLTLLGEGGMGVVHLAQAPDGRRVALKVLRPHVVGDQETRDRLSREVNSLSRVTSPRVAEILDADAHGPMPYVATRYVPGLALHDHVREEGPIAGPDLIRFAAGLAEGLQAVHRVGVVHRDIKPSNVLMEGRNPVLIDFGLARLADDARLTRTGWLLGTPGYLAPEVLYGETATPASDVHAWAATVAYAATGRGPFGTGPAMAVMDRVRRGEHDLSGVPDPLAPLVAQALAADPADRPHLDEVVTWLRRAQDQAEGRHAPGGEASATDEPVQWTQPVVSRHREPPTARTRTSTSPTSPTWTPPVVASSPEEAPPPVAHPGHEPATRVITTYVPQPAPTEPRPSELPPSIAAGLARRRPHRVQVAALLLAAGGMVALAPYVGAALLGLLVLTLRTWSVGHERHLRRREANGTHWYDGLATLLSSPGYLTLALLGTMLLLGWAAAASIAFGAVVALFHPPLALGMGLTGFVFALCTWWGPGSQRVRQVVHAGTERAASREWGAGFVVVAAVVLAAALGTTLAATGPLWAPGAAAPWSQGLLAEVARLL